MNNLRQPLQSKLADRWSGFLDRIFQPVISKLTDEEYFTCRTRRDCVRTYARRFV